ncbi:uncharacterized protein LOC143255893 [Tachypleus tridentatus]|uniref:uncharacterized protein LOC143255893 n=1 Tax=Tachypleus tridentatus TaxID=6853 RepID=UPI003FCF982B
MIRILLRYQTTRRNLLFLIRSLQKMKYFQLSSTQERLFHGCIVLLLMTTMPSTAEDPEEVIRMKLANFTDLLTGASIPCATVLDPISIVPQVFHLSTAVGNSTIKLQNITVSGLSSANLVNVSYDNSSTGSTVIILNIPQLVVKSAGEVNGSVLSFFNYRFNVAPEIIIVNAFVKIALCTSSLQVELSCSNISSTLTASSTSLLATITNGEITSIIFSSAVQPTIELSLLGFLSPSIGQKFEGALLEVVACVVNDALATFNSDGNCLEGNMSPNTFIDNILETARINSFLVDPFYMESVKFPIFHLMNGQMVGLSQIRRIGNAEMYCNYTDGTDVVYFNLTIPDIKLFYNPKPYGIFKNDTTEFQVNASSLLIHSNILIKKGVPLMFDKNFHLYHPKNITFNVTDNSFLMDFFNNTHLFAKIFGNIIMNLVIMALHFAFKAGIMAEFPNIMVTWLNMEDMEFSTMG